MVNMSPVENFCKVRDKGDEGESEKEAEGSTKLGNQGGPCVDQLLLWEILHADIYNDKEKYKDIAPGWSMCRSCY